MKKSKLILTVAIAILLQSCCIYHTSRETSSGKVSEIGIAPYKERPSNDDIIFKLPKVKEKK